MNTNYKIAVFALTLVLTMSTLGCSVAPLSKPVVSIGSPAHGAQVNVGQEVLVQTVAADALGIARVELWVDGQLATADQPLAPQSSQSALLHWTPAAAGPHLLFVKAINVGNVASDPAAVTVSAVGANAQVSSSTAPVLPPASTATAPAAEPAKASACSDDAALVEHVTVPDGTNWMPGQAFNKVWKVRNTGSCTWAQGDELVFVGGEAMTTQSTIIIPVTVPGAFADLTLGLIAPTTPGLHSGQWRLQSAKNGLFGATLNVTITVLDPAPAQVATAPQVVTPPQPPSNPGCPLPDIAGFVATPAEVNAGQTAILSWGFVSNATSAVIDPAIGGVPTPGSQAVAVNKTTTFTLTATGCGGTVTKQATISVKPPANAGAADLSSLQLQPITGMVAKPAAPANLSTTDPSKLQLQPMTGLIAKPMNPTNSGTTDVSKLQLQPMTGLIAKPMTSGNGGTTDLSKLQLQPMTGYVVKK